MRLEETESSPESVDDRTMRADVVLRDTPNDRRFNLGLAAPIFAIGGMVVAVALLPVVGKQLAIALLVACAAALVIGPFWGMFGGAKRGASLEVGTDGVTMKHEETTELLPYEAIAWVAACSSGDMLQVEPMTTVTLERRAGGTLRFDIPTDRQAELVMLLQQKIKSAEPRAPEEDEENEEDEEDEDESDSERPLPENVIAIVERAGRDPATWVRDLRSRTQGGGYREASMATADLWRIAEDPSAEPTARAGAVIALAAGLDPPDRARLRVAADSPNPSSLVRVVLDRAADGASDDELATAVDEVDALDRR